MRSTALDAIEPRHLRRIADIAVRRFDLANAKLTFLAHMENATYRVDADSTPDRTIDGRYVPNRYLLRIHGVGYQTKGTIASEYAWLRALQQHADLPVPLPRRTRNGAASVQVRLDDSSAPRLCSMLYWMHGRRRLNRPLPCHFGQLGRLIARLHFAAARWTPPRTFTRPCWNWEGLFGREGGFGRTGSETWAMIPVPYRSLFADQAAKIADLFEVLGRGPEAFGLIHADLHFQNALFSNGEVRAIDFDDSGHGYWVYDIAAALRPWRMQTNWIEFWTAFRDGYASVCPLPAGIDQLDLFITARHIATLLWAASRAAQHKHLGQSLPARCEAAARFIEDTSRQPFRWADRL